MRLIPLTLLLSCQVVRPCVDARLDRWCFHEVDDVPGDVRCDPPEYDPEFARACLGSDLEEIGGCPGGYTCTFHYFRDSEHVATRHTTDVNTYCGGFSFWYGRRVQCEPLVE